ncbi:MAG: hypothetical protein HC910_16920 [Spirulinaceae cyanobacterium SM2_1_0]|nr:hypothetical protein [Spirulinaceae cyanobacterium SM2_1_0]
MNCPFCTHKMLRQMSNRQLYWFCPHCRQRLLAISSNLSEPTHPAPLARTLGSD